MDPSSKYADKVDPMHRAMMDMATGAFHTLSMVEGQIDRFLDAEHSSHSIGHIVNPTLYRDQINSKNFAAQVAIAKAAKSYLSAVKKVQADLARPHTGDTK